MDFPAPAGPRTSTPVRDMGFGVVEGLVWRSWRLDGIGDGGDD